MRLIDKSSNNYDLCIDYQIGFGFHIKFTGGYIKAVQINVMGFCIYFSWCQVEDLP